jgi:hypothetical protein
MGMDMRENKKSIVKGTSPLSLNILFPRGG